LANLFYGVSQEHDIALIDRNGERTGFLRVLVEPILAVAEEEEDQRSKEESVGGGKCPSPLFSPNSEGCQRSGQSTLVFKDAEYFPQVRMDGGWNDGRLAFGSPGPRPTGARTPTTVMPEREDTIVETVERNTPKIQRGRFFPADSTTSNEQRWLFDTTFKEVPETIEEN
uniref:LSM14 domain-containing protein n=1 Tax=Schistocephalus solidus TaxID=70667 RepID=A0A183TS20_SCHSO